MGSLGTHTVRVANTSSCTNGEISETACGFVVEFADIITTHNMNSTATSVGGWPASEMRTYVNGDIYNALPSELQKVIISTKVTSSHSSESYTNFISNDKLYLLSTKEVWGKLTESYDSAASETRQLDYYKNEGVTDSNNYNLARKKYGNGNECWWLRSEWSYGGVTDSFYYVNDSGYHPRTDANTVYGVSPAFRIA